MSEQEPAGSWIYLAAPLTMQGYADRTEHLGLLAQGIKARAQAGGHPVHVVYPHGHIPRERVSSPIIEQDLRFIGRRMLLGDGAIHPGCSELWVCELLDHPTVQEQLGWARGAGLIVLRLSPEEKARLMQKGLVPPSLPSTDEVKGEQIFRTAVEVVWAYFDGAASILGARALPLEPSPGGRNPRGVRDAMEIVGLRIAAALGIIRRARSSPTWRPEYLPILCDTIIKGYSCREAARRSGYQGSNAAAETWAWRRRRTALGKISDVLRERSMGAHEAKSLARSEIKGLS